jgi:hypothetical protein
MSTDRVILDDGEFEVSIYEQSSKIELVVCADGVLASVHIGDARALQAMGEKVLAIASDWGTAGSPAPTPVGMPLPVLHAARDAVLDTYKAAQHWWDLVRFVHDTDRRHRGGDGPGMADDDVLQVIMGALSAALVRRQEQA